MKIEHLSVRRVKVGRDHRPIDPATVVAIAESMKLVGQIQPIVLYGYNEGRMHRLIAGRHRLEAARSLGWDFIDAVFFSGDTIDVRLRAISENLHRAELTVQERSDQVAEWSELVEQKAKVTQVASPGGNQPREAGIRKAARDLNLTQRDIQRAKKIAGITPEAKAAAKDAELDNNQTALLEVAAAAPEEQVATVHKMVEHRITQKCRRNDSTATSVEIDADLTEQPVLVADLPEQETQHDRDLKMLQSAWDTACSTARQAFLDRVATHQNSEIPANIDAPSRTDDLAIPDDLSIPEFLRRTPELNHDRTQQ
jgi:ParB-like chromosome segregation protein Spo0J